MPPKPLASTLSIAVALLAATSGCRPDDEPDRRAAIGDPIAAAGPMRSDPVDLDAWLGEGHAEVAGSSDGGPAIGDEDAGPALDLPEGAPEDRKVRARLKKLRKAAERELTRRHYTKAAERYLGALELWPADPASTAGLAAARVGQGDDRAAMDALRRLRDLGTPGAARHLKLARVDPAFEKLSGRSDFKAVTGFIDVHVSAKGKVHRKQVDKVVKLLRKEGIPAERGRRWHGGTDVTTVYYEADNDRAEAMAGEVAATFALPPRVIASKYLGGRRPVVLVLTESGLEAASKGGKKMALEELLGRKLVARRKDQVDELTIKGTGSFEWTTFEASGRSVERVGRYHLATSELALSYRLKTRTPRGGGKAPREKVQLGRRSLHELRLSPDGLILDGVLFEPEE